MELAPGRRQDPIADLTKLQKTIAWRPERSLDQTLRDSFAWWSQAIRRNDP
jgi:nucleoside-diphosphate-sugar epimerase